MTTHLRDCTTVLSEAIARRVGKARFDLWFSGKTRFALDGDELLVGVPNRHFEEWLGRTFRDVLTQAAEEVFGRPLVVRFRIDAELFQAARREQAAVGGSLESTSHVAGPTVREGAASRSAPPDALPHGRACESPPKDEPRGKDAVKRTRRWRKLSDFVVGPCNRVACAAAQSVVEAPGDAANPLVLYGPVGTGKTHLLEGIWAALRKAHPDWKVTYVTAEDFTNRFVQAMRFDKQAGFRRQFRDCDVLLLDDAHFLATKKATREEFLHTLDALVADGRQIVLTCDCHPRLSDDFGPELVDRLLGGAVWSLAPPDADTRLAILRAKSRQGDTLIPDGVLVFLAAQLRGNVRELEGAVHSLRHYGRVTGRVIDESLAREALADLLRHAVRVVQVTDVDRVVCSLLQLPAGSLQGRSRAWAISHPRMVAMFLARKHTPLSYGDVGAYFGGRNHSTVVAAEKKVRQWLEQNEELALGERRVRVRELVERAERDLLR